MNRLPVYTVSLVREGSVPLSGKSCDTPSSVAEVLRAIVGADEREHFLVLLLDARNRIKGVQVVSIGTLTASLVHPRECFRPAIVAGAAAVVVAHNHPSGDLRPSPDDTETTRRLQGAVRLLGIPLLDHVIVTAEGHFSYREKGMLNA